MVDSICKACGIIVVLVIIIGVLISGADAEFYAEEFTDVDNVVRFKVRSPAGFIRSYRIGGTYSIKKVSKPMRPPQDVRTAKHKVVIATDGLGMYFLTVYPLYQTNN